MRQAYAWAGRHFESDLAIKGRISLKDFIANVKAEIRDAVDEDTPLFELDQVELEVSFQLDASGKGGVKLFVVDIGGEVKATQVHRVKLSLKPVGAPGRPPGGDERGLTFDQLIERLGEITSAPAPKSGAGGPIYLKKKVAAKRKAAKKRKGAATHRPAKKRKMPATRKEAAKRKARAKR